MSRAEVVRRRLAFSRFLPPPLGREFATRYYQEVVAAYVEAAAQKNESPPLTESYGYAEYLDSLGERPSDTPPLVDSADDQNHDDDDHYEHEEGGLLGRVVEHPGEVDSDGFL